MRQIKSYDFSIQASGAYIVPAIGSYFVIQSLSAPNSIGVRGIFGEFSPCGVGQGLSGTEYDRLEIRNLLGIPIFGTILCSDSEIINQQVQGVVAVNGVVNTQSSIVQSALSGRSFAAHFTSQFVAGTSLPIPVAATSAAGLFDGIRNTGSKTVIINKISICSLSEIIATVHSIPPVYTYINWNSFGDKARSKRLRYYSDTQVLSTAAVGQGYCIAT